MVGSKDQERLCDLYTFVTAEQDLWQDTQLPMFFQLNGQFRISGRIAEPSCQTRDYRREEGGTHTDVGRRMQEWVEQVEDRVDTVEETARIRSDAGREIKGVQPDPSSEQGLGNAFTHISNNFSTSF